MLTHMGVTPQSTTDPNWAAWDVADLGLGQWVLIESMQDEHGNVHKRASGVYRFGKWTQPIAPAVWSDDQIPGGINRDARYIWRAPNISLNTAIEPLPPQVNDAAAIAEPWVTGLDSIRYDGPAHLTVSIGPEGGPGSLQMMPIWAVLDGSPTRWAAVAPYFLMDLNGGYPRPVSAGIFVNGKAYPCPGWEPWSSGVYNFFPGVTRAAWQKFGTEWVEQSWNPGNGNAYYNGASFEIGLGSRYAVTLAIHSVGDPGLGGGSHTVTNIMAADRSKGTARSVIWEGDAFAGPLVKGNTAIFYGVPLERDNYNHPVVRVIVDLTTMTVKTEACPDDQYSGTGMYAPSYMSDVPRLITLASSGSGEGPRRLAMDNDVIEISGENISYSGNNFLLRPNVAPTRLQSDFGIGSWVEVVTWTPDSNLAGGDDRPKGYFL